MSECSAIGTFGLHSESYGDDGDGACIWCGARPSNSTEYTMGLITIQTAGSFPSDVQNFSAQDHGHAQAVAEAIHYLTSVVLPKSIEADHELHSEGRTPDDECFRAFHERNARTGRDDG